MPAAVEVSIWAEYVEPLIRFHHDGRDSKPLSKRYGEIMATADVPQYNEMLWPTLQAVAEPGGSASIGEIIETVIKREGFSNAQQAALITTDPRPKSATGSRGRARTSRAWVC